MGSSREPAILPSKRTVPAVGAMRSISRRAVVDLPQPDFADDAQRLAGVEREADAVDGPHGAAGAAEQAALQGEVLHQALDLERGAPERWNRSQTPRRRTGQTLRAVRMAAPVRRGV